MSGLCFKMVFYAVVLGTICQSCIGHKHLVSLNGNETVPDNFRAVKPMYDAKVFDFKPYKISPFDQLMIKINAFDGNTEEFLSREFAAEKDNGQNINYDPASLYFNSYGVDASGYISLPMLGKVKVTGKTIPELKETLDTAYNPYLKFASTHVKLANRHFTIFGEVHKPGVHYLYNDRNTLLDAISMAGDFTDFGNRRKVKLIRQTDDGAETVYLNLNRSDFMYTEFYYVRPNDLIYIEPTKAKSNNISSTSIGIILSAISVGAILLNVILN